METNTIMVFYKVWYTLDRRSRVENGFISCEDAEKFARTVMAKGGKIHRLQPYTERRD